jgi:hypothetical protein
LWTVFIRIRIWASEHGSEISGFVERWEFLEQLSNYQLLKNWALLSQFGTTDIDKSFMLTETPGIVLLDLFKKYFIA